jgi:hypothetical protein
MEAMQGADPAVLRQQAEGKRKLGQTLMILSATFAATAAALALTPCGHALSAAFYKKAKIAAELAAAAFGLMGMLFSRANEQEAVSAASGFVPPNVDLPQVGLPDLADGGGSGNGSGFQGNDPFVEIPDGQNNGDLPIFPGGNGPDGLGPDIAAGSRGLMDGYAGGLGADAVDGAIGADGAPGEDGGVDDIVTSADGDGATGTNDGPLDALLGLPGQLGPAGLAAAGIVAVGAVAAVGALSARRGTKGSPDDEDADDDRDKTPEPVEAHVPRIA